MACASRPQCTRMDGNHGRAPNAYQHGQRIVPRGARRTDVPPYRVPLLAVGVHHRTHHHPDNHCRCGLGSHRRVVPRRSLRKPGIRSCGHRRPGFHRGPSRNNPRLRTAMTLSLTLQRTPPRSAGPSGRPRPFSPPHGMRGSHPFRSTAAVMHRPDRWAFPLLARAGTGPAGRHRR